MKEKKKLLNSKSLLFCIVSISLCLSVGACSKNESDVVLTLPSEEVPMTTAACVPGDIEALRAIAKANPEAHLFEGDEPGQWKKINLKWVKGVDGKYAVSELQVKEGVEIADFVLNLDGSKKTNILFSSLQCLDIVSATIKEITVFNQPALKTVRINGEGKAQVEDINVQGGEALKEITIEGMPNVTTLLLGGNAIEKILLADLPKLQEQSNLKFRNGYDADGNQVEDTAVKELTLKGDIKSLNGLYLTGLGLERFTLQASLPELVSLTLNNNKLSGSLEIKGLEKLQTLFLSNNELSSVSVSGCPALTEFDASANKGLSDFSLSLPALKVLDLNETAVSALDLSSFANLKKVSAYNAKLTSVKLSSQNTKLSGINLSNNQLPEITFPKEVSAIYLLTMNNNSMNSLDLSRMSLLERVSVNDNKLETLRVPEGAEDFELLECKNNHLTAKLLREIKKTLTELSRWDIAPQRLLARADVQKKQIDASEEINELNLAPIVQKFNGKQWTDAVVSEFVQKGGIYTFGGKGKYRVICTDLGFQDWKFDVFSNADPYFIGEIEV